jgi:hypothetical protein
MALSFPSSPSTGDRYNAYTGYFYFWDGYNWCSTGQSLGTNPINANPFLYRTMYTRGYTHCGYQGGSPWRNTNRTLHVTDTTTNLGDMMDRGASYIDGGFSDYNTYVFNDSGSVQGTSAYTSSMSMVTESLRSYNSIWNTTVNRQNCKALMNADLTAIYITGGGNSSTDKFITASDTMIAANLVAASPSSGGTAGGLSGFWGQYYGIINANSGGGYFTWSTETWTSQNIFSGYSSTDGQPKGLSSKWGYGYNASGSYAGSSTLYKFNDVTRTYASSISRPESCGEENCQVGQDWGYTLGSYNGGNQTNNSTKVSYTTDSCVAGGSTMQPKGHGGMSSGSCGTGSCLILGGVLGTTI